MRRIITSIVLLGLLLTSSSLFAQTGNGSLGGIVQDPSKALLPGVSMTLTNTGTGVTATQVSNEAGAYQFQAVPPGSYQLTAELPSFKKAVASGITISNGSQLRRDITMEIGNLSSSVEVAIAADQVLTETAASVGTVLPRQKVAELPLVGDNVLSLLDVLPGFRANPGADAQSTIGGLNLDYTNTTINGLSTVSSRDSASFWGRQVLTTNVINPELVGEIKLILSPVDAELGRGNSQIQIQTRSGTNKYTGAATWNVQNTALNANTWLNKRNPGPATPLNWYNLNQITGSYSGPIVHNKTFFFVLYDKQMVNRRNLVTTPVLTDTARQGIFRYWEGWNPGAALTADPTSFVTGTTTPTGTAASVNFDGSPLAPKFSPQGGAYAPSSGTGLKCFSVYGNKKVDGSAFTASDCPGGTAVINPSPWDPLRTTVDSTGYVKNILGMMPSANFFAAFAGQTPDGLNTGLYRYLQGRKGSSATNASIGVVQSTDDYNNRNQINVKIDHNLSEKHRLNAAWTYEKDSGDASLAAWDGKLNGNQSRRPQFLTVNATSTLSSSMVNEGRFGVNYSSEFASPAWANIDHQDITDAAQKFVLYGGTNANGKKYPVLYNPGNYALPAGTTSPMSNVFNGFMNFGSFDFANYSPLWNYADTLRWSHGKHSFSGGGEYRRPSTIGYNNSAYVAVNPTNGGGTATPLFFTSTDLTKGASTLPNFLASARNNAGFLLSTLYGAINAPNTAFWVDGQSDLKKGTWQDVTTVSNRIKSADPYGHQTRTQIENEWSFFIKDDYKVDKRLTLNIGIRYDLTGSPYLGFGLTNTLADGGLGLFGAGRPAGDDPFKNWLSPGNLYLTGYGSNTTTPLKCANGVANPNGLPASNCDPNLMSSVIFVGPGTDHPDKTLVPQKGAFSPALGASWQLPWFGEGKTTVRGGFQRTYGKPGSPYTGGLLSGPGSDGTSNGVNPADPKFASIFATRALNLTDLPLVVPATPARPPSDRVYPVGARSGSLSSYALFDPNFRNPYSDNWTLTVTRSLSQKFTLEVRAVNTLARNQAGSGGVFGTPGTFDLNTVNVYHNPELFNAFENTRKGLDDPLFDAMLMGMNLNPTITGYGPVGQATGGVLQRGSAQIRRAFAANLANGNYAAVVTSILNTNPSTGNGVGNNGAQPLPIDPGTGVTLVTGQRLLRNGCDRIANGVAGSFVDPTSGSTITQRCFAENYLTTNPQWSNALYSTNLGHTDYNSLEVQITMRPTHGFSMQTTYGFSKTMVQPGSGYTDPLHPELDYTKSAQSVGSDLRSNGTFELPIGPNKLLLGNASGVLARALEKWQMGFIYNISSGAPRTFLTGANMLYANGRPNIVGPWDNPSGSVKWDGQNGTFFPDTYITYTDPQCGNVTAADTLQANCTLKGLAKVVPAGTPGATLINPATNTYGIKLLENPKPGQQGNLGSTTLATFPRWRLDGNLSKSFQIRESVQAQLRVDATNIFNHPTPNDPTGLTNAGTSFSDTFGQITAKGTAANPGNRTFQAKLRITF